MLFSVLESRGEGGGGRGEGGGSDSGVGGGEGAGSFVLKSGVFIRLLGFFYPLLSTQAKRGFGSKL
jgi:hypothetical protein